ncbi:hypothetical protein PV326_008845, partial [Microctonus aethiopoides]
METSSQKTASQTVINHYAKQGLHHVVRTGNLFVIHFTKEMFVDNGTDNVYFNQCLKTYINVLKQKLSHNKDDYMGLMFSNTKESDEGVENICTVQKLDCCTTNMYTEVMKLYDNDITHYKNQICDTNCSIANVLLHAARAYDAVTAKLTRNVVIMTCDDNPAPDDSKERHRIRLNAKNYKDINIKLNIVGLGDNWNYDIFYKEIEMLAEVTVGRDFKRMNLADLEEEIIFKSHILGSLEFRIKNNAKLKVSIQGFLTRRRYVKTNAIGKDTNEPLDVYSWFSYQHEDDDEEFDIQDNKPEDVMKKQRFGDKDIIFSFKEVRSLHSVKPAGIDLLGFKPMFKAEPTYQIQPVLFIGCHAGSSEGELKFFAALLSKMAQKNLMAVCAVTMRLNSQTRLFIMWPSLELGGFYLYRLPFKDDVRNKLLSITDKYIFNDEDHPRPHISEQQLDTMKAIIETLYIEKYPLDFLNVRLQRLLKSVEAVALELPPVDQPQDNTLPDFDTLRNKLNDS